MKVKIANLYAISIGLAALLTGCVTSDPPIGKPAAMLQTWVNSPPARGRQQSCPSRYIECITLAYGSTFKQKWCSTGAWYSIGSHCTPEGGSWNWTVLKKGRHHPQELAAGVKPNPGNPVELSVRELQRFKPSGDKIVDVVWIGAYQGMYGKDFALVGIYAK